LLAIVSSGYAQEKALTPTEARAIAKDAYIYGFPLVDNMRVQYSYFVDKQDPDYKAPYNTLFNIPRVFTPDDKAIQTPNSDTPYSWIGLDLRAEPIVFTVPRIAKERYWSLQLIDLYTHNFDIPGSRTTGNDGGSFLIAGPNWHGEKPQGITKVIRCETEIASAQFRTQLFNPADLGNVKKIQTQYVVKPILPDLKKDEDGGLTLYIQNESPGKEKESNWLPAPKGPFLCVMRLYAPKEDALNGKWKTPPLTKVDAPVKYTFTREKVGTRYVATLFRVFMDPNDPADVKAANALQDAIKAEQANAGKLELPDWDQETLKKTRDALLTLESLGGVKQNRFGMPNEVDTVSWLLSTASGWGGNPLKDAVYIPFFPGKSDGKTPYTLTLKDVPVDAFWSITIYDEKGYLFENEQKAYSVNSVTARPARDGSFVIQFGGDPKSAANFLAIKPGWNYLMRLYRPRTEILDGTWKAPEPVLLK
jgi:hypothetical protein